MAGFPRAVRNRLLVLGLVCFGVVAAVGAAVWHVDGPIRFDDAWSVIALGRRHPATPLTLPGTPEVVAVAVGVLAVLCALRLDLFGLALCATGPALAAVLVQVVAKPLVHRMILYSLAYPSGHATLASALATLATLLVYRWYGGRAAALAGVVLIALPLLAGYGVIQRRWHFPTDVLGGIALGTGSVVIVAAVLSMVWPAARLDRPDPRVGTST